MPLQGCILCEHGQALAQLEPAPECVSATAAGSHVTIGLFHPPPVQKAHTNAASSDFSVESAVEATLGEASREILGCMQHAGRAPMLPHVAGSCC